MSKEKIIDSVVRRYCDYQSRKRVVLEKMNSIRSIYTEMVFKLPIELSVKYNEAITALDEQCKIVRNAIENMQEAELEKLEKRIAKVTMVEIFISFEKKETPLKD